MQNSCKHCGSPVLARGFCSKHYQRFMKHGDARPNIPSPNAKGTAERFVEGLSAIDTEDCVLWPFVVNPQGGYGQLCFRGQNMSAHRAVAIVHLGPRPSPKHEVAHSCGNRLCCNPRHLRWATRASNHADKWAHGTMLAGEAHPNARLTAEKVRQARHLASSITHEEIARRMGVSRAAISLAIERKTWRHLTDPVKEAEFL